ncbi:MAG: cation-translocating P-type ATPase [Elusimicrobia bacterium]|nr:cation-translocating P-type ATPase [Elusimicrobiota bacterium]
MKRKSAGRRLGELAAPPPSPTRAAAEPEGPAWWVLPPEEACRLLGTDPIGGLEPGEAGRRLSRDGPNRVPEAPATPLWRIGLRQFESPLVTLLLAAAVAAAALRETAQAGAIGAIVALNAALGFLQERRSERALAALRRTSAPVAKVVRGGRVQAAPAESLVDGDLVVLEAGDRVPADGRLVSASALRAQEASLTGESEPADKHAGPLAAARLPLGDRGNMAFQGTLVVAGSGRMVVTATGSRTELGAIAAALRGREAEPTPLEGRLRVLGRRLAALAVAAALAAAAAGLVGGLGWYEVLLVSISLAVAAIPEGLPAIVTSGLALGVTRMARRHALIRKLPAVETLGCVSVILTDKTGTLTRNEMTVRRIWTLGGDFEVTGVGYGAAGEFRREGRVVAPGSERALSDALRAAVLASAAHARLEGDGPAEIVGDPTEGALLVAGLKAGLSRNALERELPEVGAVPFDGDRKRMSVLRRSAEGRVLFAKGAPEAILQRSSSCWDGAQAVALDPALRSRVEEAAAALAAEALRVIAVARRPCAPGCAPTEALESDLTLLGLVGMIDPPRPEAARAVAACRRAGVRVVMVTGDHRETAAAVGLAIGLLDGGEAVLGEELDGLSDAALAERVEKTAVFARLSARHKTRLVRAWQSRGDIVAVTGDGVNDAPALVAADIGVAMGLTGTDGAKEAADMVITDDNFASIVSAAEEGRGIYDDIVRVVNYLLSSNLAELLVVIVGMTASWASTSEAILPLTAVQILWINLVTDGLPALALILDPLAPGAMDRPPRRPQEAILTGRTAVRIVLIAAVVAAGALAAFAWALEDGTAQARTLALTTLVALEMARVHGVRWGSGLGALTNPALVGALAVSLALQAAAVYWPPLQRLLGTVPLEPARLGVVAVLTLGGWAAILVIERLGGRSRGRT